MRSLHYMEKVENVFIAICMFFFAFSTIIGWYFFGQANVKYLFGPKAVKIYSVLAAVCVFLGSLAEVDLVWNMRLLQLLDGNPEYPCIVCIEQGNEPGT